MAREFSLRSVPEELRVVDDFPRTPSGKIKKVVLREALRAEHTTRTGR